MGSYLQTCGLSGLPIDNTDPVVGVIITAAYGYQSEDQLSGYVGSGATWQVISLPFYGTYNDYGSINLTDSKAADVLFQQFNHGLTVAELIEQSAHRELDLNLDLGHPYGRNPMKLMLMHRDLYDQLSAKGKIRWTPTTLEEQLERIPYFMEKWSEESLGFLERINKGATTQIQRRYRFDFGHAEHVKVDKAMEPLMLQRFFSFSDHGIHSCLKQQIRSEISRSYDEVGFEKLKPLFEGLLRLIFIDNAMDNLRRMWSPQTGMGAQEYHYQLLNLVHKWSIKQIKYARHRWDEDVDD